MVEIPDDRGFCLNGRCFDRETLIQLSPQLDPFSRKSFILHLDEALVKAADSGNTALVERLLAAGADVNAKDNYGDTALIAAADDGHTDIVERLLAAGADVNAQNNDGRTPLIAAAKGGNINPWDDEDYIRVARERSTDIVRRLLAVQGIKVNAQNKDGETALTIAALFSNADIVRLLLAAGADVNAKNKDGMTALMHAADEFATDADIVERLLAAPGADVNAKDKGGMTALMLAAFNGHLDMVERLLAAGADVNAKDKDGETALIAAADDGHTDIVERLLAAGADVNAQNKDGDTAWMKAADRGHTAIVNLIRGLIARRRFRGVVRSRRPLRDAKVRAAERVYAPPGAFLDEEGNPSKEGGPGYIEVFNRQMPNFEEGVVGEKSL
jgi:ankyrin repeat protein